MQSATEKVGVNAGVTCTGDGRPYSLNERSGAQDMGMLGRETVLPNHYNTGETNVATGLCSAFTTLSTTNGSRAQKPPPSSLSVTLAGSEPTTDTQTTYKSAVNISPLQYTAAPQRHEQDVPQQTQTTPDGEEKCYKSVKASIADRRSSFFNDLSRSPSSSAGIPPRSASQYNVPRSSQPLSLVHERSKRFERSDATTDSGDGSHVTSPAHPRAVLTSSVTIPMYSYDGVSRQAAMFDGGNVHDSPRTRARAHHESPHNNNAADHTGQNTSISSEVISPNSESSQSTAASSTGSVSLPSPWKSDDANRKHFFSTHMPKIGISKSTESPNDVFSTDVVIPEATNRGDITTVRSAVVTPEPAIKSSATQAAAAGAKSKKATQWTLANKMHGSHSPGSRPKKSSNEQKDSTNSSPKQKETWKGKVARTFKRYGSGSVLSPSSEAKGTDDFVGVIGVPLDFCQPSTANECVPLIVEVCTRVVEERGILNQGIYRVPGNSGLLNQLIEEINKDPVGLCHDSDKWQDVNVATSLLKLFFRKLPDPLITDDLYESVMAANRTENSERRMLKIKKLLHDLPEHNFETFHFMALHLNRVTMHGDVNKMDAHNLAIMFGPTLIRPQDDNMIVMVRDMGAQCRVIESIITHCDWFFSSWDEDVNVPVDEDTDESNPISTMNEELLAKAESLALRQSPVSSPGFAHHSGSGTYAQRGAETVKYRELVSTIINAANRKIRPKGGGGASSAGKVRIGRERRKVGGSEEDLSKQAERSSEGNDDDDDDEDGDEEDRTVCDNKRNEIDYKVTRYTAYRFETLDDARSTENSKTCIRRTQSSESLLGSGGGGGTIIGSTSSATGRPFYEEFTIRTAPREGIQLSTQLSPQLRAQLLLRRQMQAKQQFLLSELPKQQQQQQLRSSAVRAAVSAETCDDKRSVNNNESIGAVLSK